MNLILFLLRASRITVALAIVVGFVSGACYTFLIAYINNAVSRNDPFITQSVSGFVGWVIVALITSMISRFLLINLSQEAVYKLRLRLSSWILSCPLRHLEELGANRLLAALTDDVQAISSAVFNIPFICINIALIAGCLAYLAWLSLPMFLLTLFLLVLTMGSIQFIFNKAISHMKSAREEQDILFKLFRSITDGTKELKLHCLRREEFLNFELKATAASARDYKRASLRILALAMSFSELQFFVIVGLLVFGIPQFTNISNQVLFGYVLTITFMTQPMAQIMQILPEMGQASVALQKIDKLGLSLASHAENISNVQSNQQYSFKNIELIQITHSYRRQNEENNFILGPIDLSLCSGELVFIVGGNGSGKSTLAKLITGLYVPEAGEIRLDGKTITDQNREAYRQLFSAVFSDFYLFERILGISTNNLDIQAQKYLEQFQLERKVQVKQGVVSTIDLSQGQRKRLALLTAYLENRPIYLFDEWASDQDPHFREIFYKQLLPELKQRGKTVLVISHDERYFHLADRIIKIDYGKLV